VVLGIYDGYENHPLPTLRAAGIKVTLGSDDPPYFGATIAGEYQVCADRMGLSEHDLREITRTAIDAAFCEDELKSALRARL
jgi:adenosine deaminase